MQTETHTKNMNETSEMGEREVWHQTINQEKEDVENRV